MKQVRTGTTGNRPAPAGPAGGILLSILAAAIILALFPALAGCAKKAPPAKTSTSPSGEAPREARLATGISPPGISPADYFGLLFSQPDNPAATLSLPGYRYFQGTVDAAGRVTVSGKIRVIGGIATGGKGGITVKNGAVITANPDYQKRISSPRQKRYRVCRWREI
jgi:predicted small lipoprotein YifL